MNKNIIPMLALFAGVALTACEDQLDIEQKGVSTTENFYQTDADCEKALAAAYEEFQINTVGRTTLGPGIYTPARVLANHPGDDVNYGGGNYGDHEFGGSIDEFRYDHTPEAINFHYRGLYLSVYKDNLVMNYFQNPATAFQKQAVAEARVLRAYNYFLLACYWGQPPFVDHLLEADAIPTNSDMTQQEYFVWVAEECEKALPDLIERSSQADKEGTYRVTKGFANALAGKAYMFAGDYIKAKDALKKVIDSGKYDLVSGDEYLDLFHVEGDGCKEKVFEINMRYNVATGGGWSFGSGNGAMQHSTWMEANCFNWRAGNFKANPAQAYENGLDGWGSIGVPLWFGNEFHDNDGDSKRFKATLMHIDDAVYQTSGVEGMAYFDEELNNMPLEQKKTSDKIGISDLEQGLYGQSFWLPFKIIYRGNDCRDIDGDGEIGNGMRMNNIIVMRYAEVLLNYAECCLKTEDAATAKTYINKIQERAGSKTISSTVDMEVLKREKSYELWFEGCRFQDILRWNDTNGIERLKKAGTAVPHLYDKVHRPVRSSDVNVIWENGTEANSRFYIAHTHEAMDAGFTVGFKEKHRLFPYPITIMEMNPELKQNPGWE